MLNLKKKVEVHYYALLREQRGLSRETCLTEAETPASLYAELRARHAFNLERKDLKVAVNGEFAEFDHTLKEGDEIVFIPPVAGG